MQSGLTAAINTNKRIQPSVTFAAKTFDFARIPRN